MRKPSDRLLRLPEVKQQVGLGRSSIYALLDPRSPRHDPTFPKPVQLGPRAIAFSERELDSWIAQRKAARSTEKRGAALGQAEGAT